MRENGENENSNDTLCTNDSSGLLPFEDTGETKLSNRLGELGLLQDSVIEGLEVSSRRGDCFSRTLLPPFANPVDESMKEKPLTLFIHCIHVKARKQFLVSHEN